MADNSPDEPPAKRIKCDYSKSFEVLVGPAGKKFTVYYDKIADRSDFFKAARSSQWNKDSQVATDLSDADPLVFQDYLKLVYTGEFDESDVQIPDSIVDCSIAEKNVICDASDLYVQKLASLYVLADKLQDSVSANLVMDRLLDFGDTACPCIYPQTITSIYENTPQNSFLRMMLRDYQIYNTIDETTLKLTSGALPREHLEQMAIELMRLVRVYAVQEAEDVFPLNIRDKHPKCHYHQPHKDGEAPCPGRFLRGLENSDVELENWILSSVTIVAQHSDHHGGRNRIRIHTEPC